MDSKLKRLLIYFAVSAFFATFFIAGAILSSRYIASLSNTLDQFQTLKINYYKMKETVREMETTSSTVHSIIPGEYTLTEMEGALLSALDTMKSHMQGVDILMGDFEKKETEISLPLTLSGNITDYSVFMNDINYLQSLTSPFMFIHTLSIAKSADQSVGTITFNLKGILRIQTRMTGNGA
jgi:ACT domain-containing protein